MKSSLTLTAALAGAALAAPALAQDLPRWSPNQACAREASAQAFCVAFEREAYSDLSGVWPTLQPEIRKACLDQIAAFGQNSYRLLGGCVEEKLTELRVDYVRRASRIDDPDPAKPKPAEIKPEAQPKPAAATPADKSEMTPMAPPSTGALPAPAASPASEASVPQPPQASETLASTPPPVAASSEQPPAAAPATEAPKPQ